MILSGQTIRERKILFPFSEREKFEGASYGLSANGYDLRLNEEMFMRPGDFVLASTIERFEMPNDVVGIVHDKSTWARRGIAAQNTVIEAGWRGFLTLELTNHGRENILLPAGVGIVQVVFHLTDKPVEKPYEGRYQDQQSGPQPALRWNDDGTWEPFPKARKFQF